MYRVDWIKTQKFLCLIMGVVLFLLMLLCDGFASMVRHHEAYYWSRDMREGFSAIKGIEVFLGIFSFIMFAFSCFQFYLDSTGKVCAECKLVYPKSMTRCLRCKRDIIYAKSVAEYRSESPTVKKGTQTMNINMRYPTVQNRTPNVINEKFCPSCGQKMKGTDKFCPKCGTKN